MSGRIIIAGTNSGVGKTTISIGIMLALKKRGIQVQPFKIGPDYIDPTYHTQATGKASYNLDSYLLSYDAVREIFATHSKVSDISVIEGVMGLYDGLKNTSIGSTAEIAKVLDTPVILIVNARSLSRSAGAIALGYKNFDKNVKIKGIILNNIGRENHFFIIKDVIQKRTKIPVLGYLPKNKNLSLPERHLGLVPACEEKVKNILFNELGKLIEKNIDIDELIKISKEVPEISVNKNIFIIKKKLKKVKIAVAYDKAFNFYYQDNLNILKNLGAEIVMFSPLKDKNLPLDISRIYIGGGFPEIFAELLAKNHKIKESILEKHNLGIPIYAECGGLMYLMEKIKDFEKKEFQMVGIFKGSANMAEKMKIMGYVDIEVIKDNILSKKGDCVCAHVFHWSYLENLENNILYAYKIKKSGKIFHDGLISKNTLASYSHLHFASNIEFAKNFIDVINEQRSTNDTKSK